MGEEEGGRGWEGRESVARREGGRRRREGKKAWGRRDGGGGVDGGVGGGVGGGRGEGGGGGGREEDFLGLEEGRGDWEGGGVVCARALARAVCDGGAWLWRAACGGCGALAVEGEVLVLDNGHAGGDVTEFLVGLVVVCHGGTPFEFLCARGDLARVGRLAGVAAHVDGEVVAAFEGLCAEGDGAGEGVADGGRGDC